MAKSNFDKVMEDNKKLANTAIPEGAMSYADYVTASGVDSAGDLEAAKKSAETGYLAAVESAERAHDRAIGTYGQNAEAMARAGLSGSGYSDYITGNAYAAKQGSIDAAKATKQASIDAAKSTKKLTDAGTQRGYLNYIENYKTQKIADFDAAISDIVNMNLSGEGAKSYLEAHGLGSESDRILGIIGNIQAQAKADAADVNYGSAIEYAAGLINAGMSEKSIKDMLAKQYGYDAAYIDDVWAKAGEYAALIATNARNGEFDGVPKIAVDPKDWMSYKSIYNIVRAEDNELERAVQIAKLIGINPEMLIQKHGLGPESAKNIIADIKSQLSDDPLHAAAIEGDEAFLDYLYEMYSGSYSSADIDDLIARLTAEKEGE